MAAETLMEMIAEAGLEIIYRVAHKGWDFRDDCTKFIQYFSLFYSCYSGRKPKFVLKLLYFEEFLSRH